MKYKSLQMGSEHKDNIVKDCFKSVFEKHIFIMSLLVIKATIFTFWPHLKWIEWSICCDSPKIYLFTVSNPLIYSHTKNWESTQYIHIFEMVRKKCVHVFFIGSCRIESHTNNKFKQTLARWCLCDVQMSGILRRKKVKSLFLVHIHNVVIFLVFISVRFVRFSSCDESKL